MFNAINKRDLLPMLQFNVDPVRCKLDEKFGTNVLGLPARLFAEGGTLDLLRRKLAAEPSIRGSKAVEGEEEAHFPLASEEPAPYGGLESN